MRVWPLVPRGLRLGLSHHWLSKWWVVEKSILPLDSLLMLVIGEITLMGPSFLNIFMSPVMPLPPGTFAVPCPACSTLHHLLSLVRRQIADEPLSGDTQGSPQSSCWAGSQRCPNLLRAPRGRIWGEAAVEPPRSDAVLLLARRMGASLTPRTCPAARRA